MNNYFLLPVLDAKSLFFIAKSAYIVASLGPEVSETCRRYNNLLISQRTSGQYTIRFDSKQEQLFLSLNLSRHALLSVTIVGEYTDSK